MPIRRPRPVSGLSHLFKKELRTNHEIWQKSFSEHRIKDAENYARHVQYIWNNPVKKRYVERPEDFLYSSARLRDQVDPCPSWVKPGAKARGV